MIAAIISLFDALSQQQPNPFLLSKSPEKVKMTAAIIALFEALSQHRPGPFLLSKSREKAYGLMEVYM